MADFKDKLSHLISQQAPDFVLDDHPYFLEFVKAYFTFMESAELTLTNIGDPDVIQLETQTGTISFELGVTVNSITLEAEPLIFSILAIVKAFIATAPDVYVIVPAVLST